MFLIGTIIILDETISMLNVGVIDIIINGECEPEQRILDRGATIVVDSTTKQHNLMSDKRHYWKIRSIQKLIMIIAKLILKWMRQ